MKLLLLAAFSGLLACAASTHEQPVNTAVVDHPIVSPAYDEHHYDPGGASTQGIDSGSQAQEPSGP
jgi:hypothetical protein